MRFLYTITGHYENDVTGEVRATMYTEATGRRVAESDAPSFRVTGTSDDLLLDHICRNYLGKAHRHDVIKEEVPEPEVPNTLVRPAWPEYFMGFARQAATRGTCDRKKVGAVIVYDREVISTGYNGAPKNRPHCAEVGHNMIRLANGKENCGNAIHAELNAIARAAKRGVAIGQADIYTNTYPCMPCFRVIEASGIRNIYYADSYNNDPEVAEAAKQLQINIILVD